MSESLRTNPRIQNQIDEICEIIRSLEKLKASPDNALTAANLHRRAARLHLKRAEELGTLLGKGEMPNTPATTES